jgi:hypothetical protein
MKGTTKLIRDAHGLINNRGKSKYWGVTTGLDAEKNYEDMFVVSYKALDLDQTHTLRPHRFRFTEADAARVAAYVHAKGQMFKNLSNTDCILSADGKYVFQVFRGSNEVYRQKYKNQILWNPPINVTLVTADEPTAQVETPMFDATDSFPLIVKVISKMRLTNDQCDALAALIQSKRT